MDETNPEIVQPGQALQRREEMPLAPVQSHTAMDEFASVLARVFPNGITEQNVTAVKEVSALFERQQDRQAEKDFAAAFVRLQQAIPRVQATKAVPNDDGSVRYKYAPLDDIEEQAKPICLENGFSYSFKEGESGPGEITKIFILQHVGGWKRENSYTVRIGSGPPKTSDSQKDGSAHSYAKRGALIDGLCIRVKGMDRDDARNLGAPITAEQSANLKAWAAEVKVDQETFLLFAGAQSFETILSEALPRCEEFLHKREKILKQRKEAAANRPPSGATPT